MRFSLLPLALSLALLTSCAAPAAEAPTPQPTETPVPESPAVESPDPFDIQTPIVFASYSFQPQPNIDKTLLLECVSGVYDSGGDTWNRAWSGTFRFRLADGFGASFIDEGGVTSCELQLSFNAPFDLYVNDYNGDGQPDFALTQWGSFSGGDYGRMFTLNPDGTVSELPIKGDKRYFTEFGLTDIAEEDTGCFLIPSRHTYGSIDLEQIENGFLVRTLDPFSYISHGGIYFMDEPQLNGQTPIALEDVYLWDGSAFVLTEQRLLYKNLERE